MSTCVVHLCYPASPHSSPVIVRRSTQIQVCPPCSTGDVRKLPELTQEARTEELCVCEAESQLKILKANARPRAPKGTLSKVHTNPFQLGGTLPPDFTAPTTLLPKPDKQPRPVSCQTDTDCLTKCWKLGPIHKKANTS